MGRGERTRGRGGEQSYCSACWGSLGFSAGAAADLGPHNPCPLRLLAAVAAEGEKKVVLACAQQLPLPVVSGRDQLLPVAVPSP